MVLKIEMKKNPKFLYDLKFGTQTRTSHEYVLILTRKKMIKNNKPLQNKNAIGADGRVVQQKEKLTNM